MPDDKAIGKEEIGQKVKTGAKKIYETVLEKVTNNPALATCVILILVSVFIIRSCV